MSKSTKELPAALRVPDANEWASMPADSPPPGFVAWDEDRFTEVLLRVAREGPAGLDLSTPDRDRLTAAASEVVGAFWSGDGERYRGAIETSGLAIPESLQGDAGDALMESSTRSLRDSPVRLEQVRVWPVPSHEGRLKGVMLPSTMGGRFLTPDRSPDDPDLLKTASQVFAVAIPARARDGMSGRAFFTDFNLYFARRDRDGAWVLVGFAYQRWADEPEVERRRLPAAFSPPV